MRDKRFHIVLIVLLAMMPGTCFMGSCPIFAMIGPCQGNKEPLPIFLADQPGIPNEKYHLFTDRTMYAAGEMILFRAWNLSPASMKTPVWSRVLYLELMDASHSAVARGKYITDSQGSSGALLIPSTLQTGNYYLRAYTRWMRNFSSEEYASVGLVIINPNYPSVREEEISNRGSVKAPGKNKGDIRLTTDRDVYPVRSKVRLQIDIPAESESDATAYSVSVVPSLALEPRGYDPGKQEHSTISGTSARFYPETRGMMLSGKVMKNGRTDPSDFTIVHSSILGKGSGYAGFRTNEKGEFHIVLAEATGLLNLFIAAEEKNSEILIDNDFSTDHSGSVAPFSLSHVEEELAAKIMFGAQVEDLFSCDPAWTDTLPGMFPDHPGGRDTPFYGHPMKTIRIDDYVALPSLEEFIVELLPEINIRVRKDETSISLQGMHTDLSLYPPLILYDYIPVFDLEGFLKLTPEDVQRIELVNATYTRGDLTFGGILSVFSRKGDLSGYTLQGLSYFFDFEAFNDTKLPVSPDYSKGRGDLHIPDYRNTLFWKPFLSGHPGETAVVEFYTSDRPGLYTISIQGVSGEGKILTGEASFSIRSEQ